MILAHIQLGVLRTEDANPFNIKMRLASFLLTISAAFSTSVCIIVLDNVNRAFVIVIEIEVEPDPKVEVQVDEVQVDMDSLNATVSGDPGCRKKITVIHKVKVVPATLPATDGDKY